MKKFLILPLLCLSMTVMAACSNDDTPAWDSASNRTGRPKVGPLLT